MEFGNFNLLPVVLAAVVNMALGFLWYSPVLFGKPWMKLMGLTDKKMKDMNQKGLSKTYILSAIGALLMGLVFAMLLNALAINTPSEAAVLGFWLWLGFIAPAMLNSVLYENKSFNLFLINAGYQLAALMIMGVVISLL